MSETKQTPQQSTNSPNEPQPQIAYWQNAMKALHKRLADSGRPVTVMEQSYADGFTATFPQGKPPVSKQPKW